MHTKAFILIGSSMILAGCSIVTPPLEKPVIEKFSHDWFGRNKVAVYSTTASRRQVLVSFPKNIICSEAPPDVSEALVSELGLSLLSQPEFDTNVTGDNQPSSIDSRIKFAESRIKLAESQAAIAKSLETVVENLFDRSQGAQFFRDGAFHLCLALLNKAIDENEFDRLYSNLQNVSARLIETELKVEFRKLQAVKYVEEARKNLEKAIETAKNAAKTLKTAKIEMERAESDHANAVDEISNATNDEQRNIAIRNASDLESAVELAKEQFAKVEKAANHASKAVEDARKAVTNAEKAAVDEILATEALNKANNDLRNAIEAAREAATNAEKATEIEE